MGQMKGKLRKGLDRLAGRIKNFNTGLGEPKKL